MRRRLATFKTGIVTGTSCTTTNRCLCWIAIFPRTALQAFLQRRLRWIFAVAASHTVAAWRMNSHSSCARRRVVQHLRVCCCCIPTASELRVQREAWAVQSRHVRSVSRSVATSRQWWPCVQVPVTSSCPRASSQSRRSRNQSRAPERCMVRHFLQQNGALLPAQVSETWPSNCSHYEHYTQVISGFRRGVNKIFALLGCYPVWIGG